MLLGMGGWSGCVHVHLERNAPGRIQVAAPPQALDARALEAPEDPGERMVAFTAGGFAGLGGGKDSAGFFTLRQLGLEASLAYGDRETSHSQDDLFAFPRRSVGVNLGWVPESVPRAGEALIYAEAQVARDGYGVALGYVQELGRGRGGAQLTGFFGPFYARARYFPGGMGTAEGGLFFKIPSVVSWSR